MSQKGSKLIKGLSLDVYFSFEFCFLFVCLFVFFLQTVMWLSYAHIMVTNNRTLLKTKLRAMWQELSDKCLVKEYQSALRTQPIRGGRIGLHTHNIYQDKV